MKYITYFPSVKVSITTTKCLAALAVVVGIVVIVLFAVFFLIRKKSLLIDYLPNNTPFWFWQRGGGYDARAVEFLGLLGLDTKIRPVLKEQKSDLIIYLKDGEWYRLSAKGLDGEPKREGGDVFRSLTADRATTIVGFAHADYIDEHLGSVFATLLGNAPYYFMLKPAPKMLAFRIAPRDAVLRNRAETQIPLPEFSPSVILAFQTQDIDTQKKGAEYIQQRLKENVAFQNPVVIEKTLPDGTVSKERIVDPELFEWVPGEPNFFDLVVEDKVAFTMYEDEKRVVVSSSKQDIAEGNAENASISGFFYMNLEAVSGIDPGDILGKSDALSWLQRIAVKRIIVGETKTYVQGELTF